MSRKKETASQKHSWPVVRRFLTIFLLLSMLVVIITAAIYFSEVENKIQLVKNEEVNRIRLLTQVISTDFESVVSDLMILSENQHLQAFLTSSDEQYQDQHLEALTQVYLSFAARKALYDQIRLLNDTGMEIVRIDFNDGEPGIVPVDQLQFKGDRYYFQDTFQLEAGQVFVSPLDLNIEQGEIEQPLKPMIRFGTPVFDGRGHKLGIVILNYFGARLISHLKWETPNALGQIMLINVDGFWLKGPSLEDEWGFMYPDRGDRTFGNAFPAAWQQITGAESGQFQNLDGLYTFATVYPLLEAWKSSTGSSKAFEPSVASLEGSAYYWKIVGHVPRDTLNTRARDILGSLLLLDVVLLIAIAIGSWVLAHALVHRNRAEEALRESEERFRQMADNIGEVFWMSSADRSQLFYVNPAFEEIWGRTRESVYKQPRSFLDAIHPEDREGVIASIEKEDLGKYNDEYEEDYRIVRPDGSIRNLWVHYWPIQDEGGRVYRIAGTAVDITERKLAEEQIHASLREKEVLLREIHHRVKNNMQVISSLLSIQGRHSKNEYISEVFKESQNRIRSMALVHEKLYQYPDLARIDFAEYVQQLVAHLFFIYQVNPATVKLQMDLESVSLEVDAAIPCGLILNELISNSLKYAFPGDRTGEMRIELQKDGENITIVVGDDGVGLPKDLDWRNTDSLGLELVTMLTHQLNAEIELDRSCGTRFKITFAESG